MIYNFISSQAIIAKVMSDLDIHSSEQRVTDMIEWIGEAMDKIGAVQQYEFKQSGFEGTPVFKIENYQASLPEDLYAIEEIAYSKYENGPWINMRTMTGSFKGQPDSYDPKAEAEDTGSMIDEIYWPLTGIQKGHRNLTNFSPNPQYFLKPGFVVTNRQDGFLKIAYKAIRVDCYGYPLVPDSAAYQEAIYRYIVMKLMYPEFLSGRMNENRYYHIEQKWNYHRKQAYGEAMMPTSGDMISIKNQWLKLVPDIDAERVFYSTTGEPQKIYNNYYGRIY